MELYILSFLFLFFWGGGGMSLSQVKGLSFYSIILVQCIWRSCDPSKKDSKLTLKISERWVAFVIIHLIHFNVNSIVPCPMTALLSFVFINIRRLKLLVLPAIQTLVCECCRANTTTSVNKISDPGFTIQLTGQMWWWCRWLSSGLICWRTCGRGFLWGC